MSTMKVDMFDCENDAPTCKCDYNNMITIQLSAVAFKQKTNSTAKHQE